MTRQPHALSGLPVDSHRLEELGKQAAQLIDCGPVSLTDAVVQTVGHLKLNAEQVRRVVEFANLEAFQSKFSSMDPSSPRYVSFEDGPADPVAVLQALDSHRAPTKIAAAMDYLLPPKTAETTWDEPTYVSDRTPGGAKQDIFNLQSKLSAAHVELVQSLESTRLRAELALDKLAADFGSAVRNGAPAAVIFSEWQSQSPKLAAAVFTRVSGEEPPEPMKLAGQRLNPQHPVMAGFSELAEEVRGVETVKTALQQLEVELARVGNWLREHGGLQ